MWVVTTKGFKVASPLTPGTRPVCVPPWVPHAYHEESGHPTCLQQLLSQPHLPHCCDPISMPSHQATVQHRLYCLPLCWLRNMNYIYVILVSIFVK